VTRTALLVVAIAFSLSFFRLGAVTLFDVDEAVFSESTKEMVESGDWITPTYNGANRFDKPILFYWLMAASYKAFGINEFGARFPSALCAFILVPVVFFFVRHYCGEKHALYAAVSLSLSPYFFGYSHAAVTDMALTLFITLSLFSFFLYAEPEGIPSGKEGMYMYGFYLFSGLAFLTKGLVGVVFPFGIALLYGLLLGGRRGAWKFVYPKGILLFVLISLPWYGTQVALNGREFIDQFFVKHHLRRYLDVISGHKGPVYYYIPALLVGFFPWVSFVPAGIRNALGRKERLPLFALLWLAFIFVFFSLSTTKLPNYILPAVPAVSILAAAGMTAEDTRWRSYSGLFMGIEALVFGIAFLLLRGAISGHGIRVEGTALLITAILLISLAGFYIAKTGSLAFGAVSGLMVVFLALASLKVLPVVDNSLQGTLHKYSIYAKERLVPKEGVVLFRLNNPSILFYSGRKAVFAWDKAGLETILGNGMPALVIARSGDVDMLAGIGLHLIEKDEKYALLERK
jgi:4-amino-4-deoxy-L-arabinose transferase-like glycosyltransferase